MASHATGKKMKLLKLRTPKVTSSCSPQGLFFFQWQIHGLTKLKFSVSHHVLDPVVSLDCLTYKNLNMSVIEHSYQPSITSLSL